MKTRFAIFLLLFSWCIEGTTVYAQTGTLNGMPSLLDQNGKPLKMTDASLVFQAPPKQRFYKEGDIIYVEVKDRITYSNTADNQRKKKIESKALLTAWTKVSGLFQMPMGVTQDLPQIGGTIDHKTQNEGSLTRNETINFLIACSVTDIRDNGNLVIEGTRRSGIGEEGRIITVSGIVRPDTIGTDNKVDSSQVADWDIRDVPRGNVYDTVRRPWGTRLLEQLKPF